MKKHGKEIKGARFIFTHVVGEDSKSHKDKYQGKREII